MNTPLTQAGQLGRVLVCVLALAVVGAACTGVPNFTSSPPSTPTLAPTAAPIVTASPAPPTPRADAVAAAQAVRLLFERHTDAWDVTKSADAVLALWADEVRFTDLIAGWRDEPRATLEQMVRASVGSPGLGSSPHSYFIDTTGGVDSYDVWGLGDATEANPVHEVDVLETHGGLFTSMQTVYDLESLARITHIPVSQFANTQTLLQDYADAWSSRAPTAFATLYAEAASRTNTLWGPSAEGRQQISDAATRSFSPYASAVWQLDLVFGDGARQEGMSGGAFTVRLTEPGSCDLGAVVVLETNAEQQIVTERVYWELDSLLRCGLLAGLVTRGSS